MCGIFGYVGHRHAIATCLQGLKQLEYRGYDSAGIAGLTAEGALSIIKRPGKVDALVEATDDVALPWTLAIAHTRWATHGNVSQENAHPHQDRQGTLAVVHNGIIENHVQLRGELASLGVSCPAGPDTVVLAELLGLYPEEGPLATLQRVLPQLHGAYAFVFIHRSAPGKLFAVAHRAPLAIGTGHNEGFIASDARAFAQHTEQVLFLQEGEIAVLSREGVQLWNIDMQEISRAPHLMRSLRETISKGGMPHYFLKEVHEQPASTQDTLEGRLGEPSEPICLPELIQRPSSYHFDQLLCLGCGSSHYAGRLAALWCEELLRVPARAEIASEFRYRRPVLQPSTLAIAISQSGETADTLAAVTLAQAHQVPVLGMCNVEHSTLYRQADVTSLLHAGAEVSVASSKAFSSQLVWLFLWLLSVAEQRGTLPATRLRELKQSLSELPALIAATLEQRSTIARIARSWGSMERCFFIGRRWMTPIAAEGALKLRELAYVDAMGYAAGELKHGSIALIEPGIPTVALLGEEDLLPKMLSNTAEIRARGGSILAVVPRSLAARACQEVECMVEVPEAHPLLQPILHNVVCQLLAYHIAVEKGCEIDQPRNLAKAVTVE